MLKLVPNSGNHSPAIDLSEVFDATAQSFALVSATPANIATVSVDSTTGEVAVTPLNLLEFAFGLNPMAMYQPIVSQATIVEHAGSRFLSLRYRHNRWASQFLDLSVERSLDPGSAGSWHTGETTRSSVRPIGGAIDEITERSHSPISAQPAEYLRLRIK